MWQIAIAVGLIGLIILGFVIGAVMRFSMARCIRRTGRVITWEEALARIREGRGCLVENHSSLPGDLWWIPVLVQESDPRLYDLVKDDGLMVIEIPSGATDEVLSSDAIQRRVRRLACDPFDERAHRRHQDGFPQNPS